MVSRARWTVPRLIQNLGFRTRHSTRAQGVKAGERIERPESRAGWYTFPPGEELNLSIPIIRFPCDCRSKIPKFSVQNPRLPCTLSEKHASLNRRERSLGLNGHDSPSHYNKRACVGLLARA